VIRPGLIPIARGLVMVRQGLPLLAQRPSLIRQGVGFGPELCAAGRTSGNLARFAAGRAGDDSGQRASQVVSGGGSATLRSCCVRAPTPGKVSPGGSSMAPPMVERTTGHAGYGPAAAAPTRVSVGGSHRAARRAARPVVPLHRSLWRCEPIIVALLVCQTQKRASSRPQRVRHRPPCSCARRSCRLFVSGR
jgi:hypothetical protein